jgi:nucleoside-diphosphate-sugar epimerase
MRIALTGATGFSGPIILQRLLEQGHEVSALARKPEALSGQDLRVVKGDLLDVSALSELVKGADCVLHVAAATAAPSRRSFFNSNLEGTRKLYFAARSAGVRRFVFVSSMAAREPQLSSYGASKAAAEHFLLGQYGGPDVLVLRPPAIYGPGDKAMLPLMKALQSRLALVPGTKGMRFALMHVRDFAQVAAEAVSSPRTGRVELDDGHGAYDWNAMIEAARHLTGLPQRVVFVPKPIAYVAAGVMDAAARLASKPSLANPGKVNELYHADWSAQGESWPRENAIPLSEGLPETLSWYRQHGWLPPLPQETRSAE